MKNLNLVLATNQDGKKITIKDIEYWIEIGSKKELADFFYDRFYIRYLKPFEYDNEEYKKSFKNGFSIMTSCCLLIESFVSFTNPKFTDTKNKSERCFGYFFSKHSQFNCFSKGGLELNEYINAESIKNKGISNDFYKNVRCGILHNGETKNNWKILRKGKLFDEENKSINASLFLSNLKIVINRFQNELIQSNFDEDEIWQTYKLRLKYLIEKSHSE